LKKNLGKIILSKIKYIKKKKIFTDKDIDGKVLDHLGLVSSTIDKLGIIEKIGMVQKSSK